MNLGKGVKITRLKTSQTVGTGTISGNVLDMQGFDGVLFIAEFGTITDGTPSLKAQDGSTSNLTDASDLAGTAVTTAGSADGGKAVTLDVFRPLKRYIRPQVVRGGATGAVVDSVLAIQYSARSKPTVHDTSTVAGSKTLASPANGTA